MNKLNNDHFPHAGMKNLIFRTVDGIIHRGRYDFNETGARRWFDENNKQYASNQVIEWDEIHSNAHISTGPAKSDREKRLNAMIEELADISSKLAVRLSDDQNVQLLFMKYTEKVCMFLVEYVKEEPGKTSVDKGEKE